jgi:hypothetical protein
MSIKRVFAAATTLGVIVTLAAPALTSPANARMAPLSKVETVAAANRDAVKDAKGGGGNGGGGGHKPGGGGTGGSTNNLIYQGGVGGVGIETSPKVYVVFWGQGWSSDPYSVKSYLTNFLSGLYGSQDHWSTSTTQYCQNVPAGTTSCAGISGAQFVTHPASSPLAGTWSDTTTAPSQPTQSQLAAEAVRAAKQFGNTSSSSNASVQYVIATAHNNNSAGFGTQYCAWHSSTSSTYGNIAYTNLPYMPDAGSSCGANFVNGGSAGALDGVSMVAGHEYTETITDQFPNGGWLDAYGEENADKCSWISSGSGAAANITLSTGTFAVQTLWSNATGACALSY